MSVPYFGVPFATSGDLLTGGVVPIGLQPDGSISYTLGWGPDYELEDTQPGYKPVGRKEMNTMFNAVTSAVGEIQFNGLPLYRAAAAPYPINAVVRHNDTNWRSTVINNSTVPGAVGASWVDTALLLVASETVAGVIQIATQPEVSAGTDDAKAVTSKKLATWFGTKVVQATEAVAGIAKIATQALLDGGVDDVTMVTPKKIKNGYVANFSTNGYIKFPTWLGGFVVQWGRMTFAGTASVAVSFPLVFPTNAFFAGSQRVTSGVGANALGISAAPTLSGVTFVHGSGALSETDFWWAVGN